MCRRDRSGEDVEEEVVGSLDTTAVTLALTIPIGASWTCIERFETSGLFRQRRWGQTARELKEIYLRSTGDSHPTRRVPPLSNGARARDLRLDRDRPIPAHTGTHTEGSRSTARLAGSFLSNTDNICRSVPTGRFELACVSACCRHLGHNAPD